MESEPSTPNISAPVQPSTQVIPTVQPSAANLPAFVQPSVQTLHPSAEPSTATILQVKSSAQLAGDQKTPKKKKKKKEKKKPNVFEIPGVHKMVLSEKAQKVIGCIVGDTVTSEKPWIFVDKELLTDNLEIHEESSEFLPIKNELLQFPRKQILIGYIPDESREYDEFYICVTEEASDIINEIIEKMKKDQEDRLYNSINKAIGKWVPQGTAEEVDDGILKNNRPLIEVEVETKYPIFPNKIQFRTVPAENRRDGYMELKCTDDSLVNVHKSRIDAYVQVAPQVVSAEAQTNCTYPKNSTTEYLYTVEGDPEKIFEKCTPSIVKYADENMENVSDMLTVNGVINLYTDDYAALCPDPHSKTAKSTPIDMVKEQMIFMDVDMCKEKMVTHAVWHPMWTGTIAIAYGDYAPNIYLSGARTDDIVMKAVYDINPVLLWSSQDVLTPKLILESPRQTNVLSFCPFDENILIGGLNNGQIIIWDIRNKLNKVEELEVLTTSQQKYRAHMNSLMGWMKNIHDLALVRPTVLSDLKYSHRSEITGIIWMSPHHEYTRLGKVEEIPEEAERRSMQFLTCGKDGVILIWDLLKKPKIEPGGFKIKKLKRLQKKPSALLVDVSPFKILHLNLRPIYSIHVPREEDKTRLSILTGCAANFYKVKYVEANPVKGKKADLTDRIIYKPVLERNPEDKFPFSQIYLGSVAGDCRQITWEGQDFESGEVVNHQLCSVLSTARYHDAPVTTVDIRPETNAVLTVGGKIFAIWREDFKDRPVLWRRNKFMYTKGEWSSFQPYLFKNQIINGDVEKWILCKNSKAPVSTLSHSSEFLSHSAIHPRRLKKNIYGAADKQGIFRLYALHEDTGNVQANIKKFKEFLDREIQRKRDFITWQSEWNKKYAKWIQQREEEAREQARKEEEAKKEKEAQLLEEKPPERPKAPQPGDFIEMIKEHRQRELESKIKKTIITKKQLDTKELEKRRKPLQKLEEENEQKKKKQKKRLKEGETIYRDMVAMLFPEVVREKPPPPPDPYAGGDLPDEMEACYKEYPQIEIDAEDYIDNHPYVFQYSWTKMIQSGLKRKRLLEPFTGAHLQRHAQRKVQRELEEKARLGPPPPPPPVVVEKEDEDDDDFPFLSQGTETED